MTTLRPFFSFYGSKWRLAPKYPEPKYDTIIEPFAGSAGYSLHYPNRQVILVERDPRIAAIWSWLISASPDDVMALPTLKQGESLSDYDVPQEARWLMGYWINQSQGQPRNVVTSYGATDGKGKGYDRLAIWKPRVISQLSAIRHWVVIQGTYSDAPNTSATWFIDPPYQIAGSVQYRFNSESLDFTSLSVWCQMRAGQVIVCENEGASWLPFDPFSIQQGTSANGKVNYSKEVVWLKDDSP
jgi:hypothetical protein